MAFTTLIVLLLLELIVATWLRRMSLQEYVRHFATIRGVVSLVGYSLVSAMCVILARKRSARS